MGIGGSELGEGLMSGVGRTRPATGTWKKEKTTLGYLFNTCLMSYVNDLRRQCYRLYCRVYIRILSNVYVYLAGVRIFKH